ncbi:hypothetical protein C943_02514 [Mariniradius saccharolyticus AK6]|uniref:Uncharacterized protein n=1 Tax=Mariniradius saccharolyticus AK6 TaxID=1239962 RepID=M7XSA0_9BACT|nr:hypothetical protein C943_02514 [Mariniradius saccharolyticus AK6]
MFTFNSLLETERKNISNFRPLGPKILWKYLFYTVLINQY